MKSRNKPQQAPATARGAEMEKRMRLLASGKVRPAPIKVTPQEDEVAECSASSAS